MRLVVAAIGRLKDSPERELVERYCKRADQTGKRIGFRDVEVLEIKESRAQEVSKRMLEESIALANVIPEKAITVILDQRGESLDSGALASRLGRWRDDGAHRRAGVDKPHRRRSFADGKPLGDDFGGAGKVARLAEPEAEAGGDETDQPKAGAHEGMGGTAETPHADRERVTKIGRAHV